jgi:hypothetical protein
MNQKCEKAVVALGVSLLIMMSLSLPAKGEDPDYGNDPCSAHPIDPNGAFLDGVISTTADEDWFSFTAKEAGLYRIKFHNYSGDYKYLITYDLDELGNLRELLWFYASAGETQTQDVFVSSAGTCWLKAFGGTGTYRVSVNELGTFPTDTYPDSCIGPAALTVGAPPVCDGITDFGLDEDWFTFDTAVLHKYQITFTRASNCDTVFALYDTSCGDCLLGGGDYNRTLVSWYGGSYDLRVYSASINMEGYYCISVKDLGQQGDDYGNTPDAATPVNTDGSYTVGVIQYIADFGSDEDWFSFTAKEAGLYRIKFHNYSGDYKYLITYDLDELGNLRELLWLYASAGETQTQDVFVSSAGTCWLKAFGGTGTYRVSVNELGTFPTDTYPDSCVGPAALTVGAPPLYDGITDFGLDEDWFTFETTVLHKYQIIFTRAANCDIVFGLYDNSCGGYLLDGYSTNCSFVPWYGGNYDLRVYSGSINMEGYYTISVKDLGQQGDDYGNDPCSAHPIDPNGSYTVGVIQYIADFGSDEDWFSFTAKEAGLYQIKFHNYSGDYKYLEVYDLDELGNLRQLLWLYAWAGETQTQDVFVPVPGPCWLKAYGGTGTYRVCVLGPLPPEPRCGDANHPYPLGDINNDCVVDFTDFAIFADNWLKDNRP